MARFRWVIVGLALCSVAAAARAADKDAPAGVAVDPEKRTVTIDAKIAPRKIDDPKYQGVIYPIEVIACWAYPKGQKAHETVVTTEVKPSAVHQALAGLGLKPGKPAVGDTKDPPQGPAVQLFLEFTPEGEAPKRVPIERALVDPKTNKAMPKVEWRFTGSVMKKPNPDKDEEVYGADLTGTLIAIFPVTGETVFQTNLTLKEEKFVKLETNKTLLPKEGTPVKLVIVAPAK